jgi:hypothetical protein
MLYAYLFGLIGLLLGLYFAGLLGIVIWFTVENWLYKIGVL